MLLLRRPAYIREYVQYTQGGWNSSDICFQAYFMCQNSCRGRPNQRLPNGQGGLSLIHTERIMLLQ